MDPETDETDEGCGLSEPAAAQKFRAFTNLDTGVLFAVRPGGGGWGWQVVASLVARWFSAAYQNGSPPA